MFLRRLLNSTSFGPPLAPCRRTLGRRRFPLALASRSLSTFVSPRGNAEARSTNDIFLERLIAKLGGEHVSTSTAILEAHGKDESYHPPSPPDFVVYPTSDEHVIECVKLCSEHRMPIIPFGAGTSLEGHISARHGGLCLDMSRMDRIVETNPDDLDCRVEAGVTRVALNSHLRDNGLFFPVDPGAECTIGGMAATRASGTNAVRYGTMRECVLGLSVVLPSGELIRTGTRAKKSSAGYDLTRLFVGSEGTLGVITEVSLRLSGIPQCVSVCVCPFNSDRGAVQTVIEAMQIGVPLARIEFLDEIAVRSVNKYSKTKYFECPTLFMEFHGSSDALLEEQMKQVEVIARDNDWSGSFQSASSTEERNTLWQARHKAYYAALALRPNGKGIVTDICVPISKLYDSLLEAKRLIQQYQMIAPIMGHVGDGNYHIIYVVDRDSKEDIQKAKSINQKLVRQAIDFGGTCSGEHGVGLGKLEWLSYEHGARSLAVMHALKHSIDPLNIMNPGKLGSDASKFSSPECI